MQVQLEYPERESRTLEFKEFLREYRNFAKTAIAFANGIGGTIIVGIVDKTRAIIGLSESSIEKYLEEIPRAIFQMVTPHLMVHVFEKNFEGRSLLCTNIYPGDNKPYYLTKEGAQRGIYVRVGAHTMRANEQFIEELKLQRENRSYDEALLHRQSADQLDMRFISQQFAQKVTDHLLESNRIVGRDHVSGQLFPTIGGVIMFHPNPSSVIPEAYISCARMKGESGRDIIERQELTGPLPTIAESAITQVGAWLERDLTLHGSKLEGKPLIPREALREGIFNAVLHRKYNIPGAVKITLWANRLEIFSPGHFVGLMDLKNLGDGTTYIRNRVICALARKIRLMEKRGTGIRLIIDSCRALGKVEPVFEEGADWVKLTFRFLSPKKQRAQTTEGIFAELMKSKEIITNREVVSACSVSREKANQMIRQEIERGRLREDGRGRSTKYWVMR